MDSGQTRSRSGPHVNYHYWVEENKIATLQQKAMEPMRTDKIIFCLSCRVPLFMHFPLTK
jgi:hypothetical protein